MSDPREEIADYLRARGVRLHDDVIDGIAALLLRERERGYGCPNGDADGNAVAFGDLLSEGDEVGPVLHEDAMEADYVDAVVVRRPDGLWVESNR